MAYADFEFLTVQRAKQRGLILHGSPESQLTAVANKLGALAHASALNDRHGIRDGVGDVMTALITFCAMQGVSLTNCLAESFDAGKHDTRVLLPGGEWITKEEI